MQRKLVIGIDVGTGSVRAGVFDLTGTMAGYASADIRMWKPAESFAEQSTPDIWDAACRSVREAIRSCGASEKDAHDTWERIVREFTARVKSGQVAEGFLAAVAAVGHELATHFPAEGVNPNELPDHLVEL